MDKMVEYMKKFGLLLLFAGSFSGLWAQGAMSLEECRRLALENNKQLKIAEEQIRSAQAKKEAAFTRYLPALDVAGTYLRNQKEVNLLSEDAHLPVLSYDRASQTYRPAVVTEGGKPLMGPGGQPVFEQVALLPKDAMTVDDRNTVLLQLGLTQPVYVGGKIRAYNRMAGLSEQLAQSGREQEWQEVIQKTDEAYWQIVSLVNRHKLAEQYVETLEKLDKDVALTYETGMATRADLLSVRVKLNQAEMSLLRVEDGLVLARMALNQLCGLPVDTVFPLREEKLETTEVTLLPAPALEEVYRNRPEISSLSLATDIYRTKEKIARSEYLPTVALMANYLAMTPSFFDGIRTRMDGMWSVGIGVKAPVFHWGASRKTLRSARSETRLMNYKLEEAKEKIELQVNQARFQVKEAVKKAEMAGKNREKADENLKYARLSFQEGAIPVSNVLEAQTAWLSAHADLIDARIEVKLCEVYLQKAYGLLGKTE